MTSARIVYLYEAMDAAYDAEIIDRHSKALGHAPLIDRNFRSQHEARLMRATSSAHSVFGTRKPSLTASSSE
jgi:hypothetical protein